MNRRILDIILITVALYCFSFLLNFLWEALHGVFLYEAHNFSARRYVPMLLYVSSMDGTLVVLIYWGTSALVKNVFWMEHFEKMPVFTFMLIGLIAAGMIEYRAVFLHHRWAYRPEMPTVFGIGLSPLLQLSTTGFISVALVNAIFFWKGLRGGIAYQPVDKPASSRKARRRPMRKAQQP